LHAFSKQGIEGSPWYDIEPFLGYSGPISTTKDTEFIDSALTVYRDLCKSEDIIAEIVRFNPLLQNHKLFEKSSAIKVFSTKEVVIIDCFPDEMDQLQKFKSSTRRNIKNYAIQNYESKIHPDSNPIDSFLDLYYKFMGDIEAKQEWHFPKDFFKRAEKSSYFKLAEILDKDGVCSASLVIEHKFASYYFLGANRLPRSKGAHELLLLKLSVDAAKKGINKLILGGGNSASPDDALLRYKKKFAEEAHVFYMGKIVHNEIIFQKLCDEAIARKPEIADLNFFLKYRL
jgi:hypothetical protein